MEAREVRGTRRGLLRHAVSAGVALAGSRAMGAMTGSASASWAREAGRRSLSVICFPICGGR